MNAAEEKHWKLSEEKKFLTEKVRQALSCNSRPVTVDRFSKILDIMRSQFPLGQAPEDCKNVYTVFHKKTVPLYFCV